MTMAVVGLSALTDCSAHLTPTTSSAFGSAPDPTTQRATRPSTAFISSPSHSFSNEHQVHEQARPLAPVASSSWRRFAVAPSAIATFGFGLFGFTSPAHVTSDVSEAAAASAIHPTPCNYNGATNQVMTRSMAVTRARSWIGKTPYSQEACYTNSYGDYRTDCSRMVAMA
jgi:hypothetical protein